MKKYDFDTDSSPIKIQETEEILSGVKIREKEEGIPKMEQDFGLSVPQIEKDLTELLVAVKVLREEIHQWFQHESTSRQVFNAHAKVDYQFNIVCRNFASVDIDVSDLANVPELLRDVLEPALDQKPSVKNMEQCLSRFREIIITLLHGLKRKQQELTRRHLSQGEEVPPVPENSEIEHDRLESLYKQLEPPSQTGTSRSGKEPQLKIGTLAVIVHRAKNLLPDIRSIGKQDPYCVISIGQETKVTETDQWGGETPKWYIRIQN